jgi:peroxiredoxin Q/BCP
VALFAASCDDVETNTKFAKSLGLDYPILSDPDKKTAKAYGVVGAIQPWPSRWTFYIDKDGIIRHVDKSVKAGTAGADMAARLAELKL